MIRPVRTAGRLWPAAVLKLEILSANLAIGTASAFVLVTAGVSLAIDRETPPNPLPSGNWSLRGSISAKDMPRDARGPTHGCSPVFSRVKPQFGCPLV